MGPSEFQHNQEILECYSTTCAKPKQTPGYPYSSSFIHCQSWLKATPSKVWLTSLVTPTWIPLSVNDDWKYIFLKTATPLRWEGEGKARHGWG
ncbi:hypothetical protein AVEN_211889-1 [Araneus ventricosus]|uniref:Uncharacterized protein n=1 Tax=Araneus ventricosus TaxID=182803 RepID=A0A4Y2F2N1_ARAVE|nr:hypothetical protein AVEN_211889-1 [Araneus ventricosus]